MQSRRPRAPARTHARPGPATPDAAEVRAALDELMDRVADFIPIPRVEATARAWLARVAEQPAIEGSELPTDDEAFDLAMDLALATPSNRGETAFDRLARRHPALGRAEQAALRLVGTSAFRLLRIENGRDGAGVATLADLATGERLLVLDEAIGPHLVGTAVLARPGRLPDGRHLFIAGVTPLDAAGLALATAQLRDGTLSLRAVEAVFRHVLRQGTPGIPGLNRPTGEEPGEDPTSEPSEAPHPAG